MPEGSWIAAAAALLSLALAIALLLLRRRDASAAREAARRQEALLNQIADELLAHQEAQTALTAEAIAGLIRGDAQAPAAWALDSFREFH